MFPHFLDTGISPSLRLLGFSLAYIALAAWLKYVVAPRPPGAARVIAALPFFGANFVCPLIFNSETEVMQRLSTVFVFTWLCNFKVLAFCWGRPPFRESMTISQLAAIIMLPLFPQPPESSTSRPHGRLHDTAGSGTSLVSRWVAKIVLLGSVSFLLFNYSDVMPAVLRHYSHAFGLYAFVGFLMDGPAAVAVETLGLQLIPTFDQPWLSSSLADFWGRRWNIPTASVLRTVVYDPIMDGYLVLRAEHTPRHSDVTADSAAPSPLVTATEKARNLLVPSSPAEAEPHEHYASVIHDPKNQHQHHDRPHHHHHHHHHPENSQQQKRLRRERRRVSWLRRQLALHATFFVSGVVHEYIAWLVNGKKGWGWKWMVFFWVQAPLMTLEALASRVMKRAGLQLPRPLAILLTLAVMELVAYDLFFGFVERDTDLATRVITSIISGYSNLLAPLQPAFASLVAGLRL